MANEQHYIDFDEYIRQGEPAQREAAYPWSTAIGLQAVDGLQVSDYLLELARKNIEGELTMDEVSDLLDKYYAKKRNSRTAKKEYQTYTRVESVDKEKCRRGRQLNNHPDLDGPTSTPTSTGQVPEQVPEQVRDLFHTNNPLIVELIKAIGYEELSVSQMMEKAGLKHRPNFLEYHLNPSVQEGYVCILYPHSPRHPRQKYLLTAKGLALFKELN